jgi:2-polyprenyl-3-methyl-5-hydroxy-6-metoxy-1,4-benzoquinol methylase
MPRNEDQNQDVQRAWDTNAKFWDQRMAEGNAFFKTLLWPAVEKLLGPVKSNRWLDVACGNGLTSRRLAQAGARVTAFDFSEPMIQLAKTRGGAGIDYRVMDATDRDALFELGTETFDGALCNMALMDMANIHPLMQALGSRLASAAQRCVRFFRPASLFQQSRYRANG